ncbi:hypothetical protein G5714_003233 [Onychostoma macrolepis]|uniref:Uncharacterized protein n=1 Tax=Onychostoma macrolepis TaxID=369639 RepID=A0A7J6D9Y6_9TELE|nr:hypothetical protein G5714_003233 [Onychostoma macrolepis]
MPACGSQIGDIRGIKRAKGPNQVTEQRPARRRQALQLDPAASNCSADSPFTPRSSIAAVPVPFATAIRRKLTHSKRSKSALLQMPRRYCGSCRSSLHADDGHSECVSCLGKPHADAVLAGSDCSHCKNISLASLRSRIAFFSESDSAPRDLPFSSSQGPVRSTESELTSAQIPRA